jgi:4-amino-4-deoxy-L-arabinose transferase-like glycosyltransferase
MNPDTRRIYILLELLIVFFLCYFPLCYRIDSLSIRQWDEARNAVNAMEMLQNKNYIVRYYEGNPEVWEVKPPLLIWLQVASLKAFGYNELAIRFPVMIATILTVLLLIWYFHNYYQNRYIGYLAALVLVTSQGYIDRHIARTGDHDALLILFTTSIILFFYRYITSDKPKSHILIAISLLFVLGVLTKSEAALFILPGLFISIFIFQSGKKIFFDKWLYFALLFFIASVGGYYALRESLQPGYLNAVWHEEWFLRYANIENKFDSGTFWFYGLNFFQSRFSYWIYFLLLGLIILPFMVKQEKRKLYYYLFVNIISFFLVISCGSKGLWYDGPLFPLFSIIIALFLYQIYQYLQERLAFKKTTLFIMTIIITFIIFFFPGVSVFKKVGRNYEYPYDKEYYSMCYVLRDKKIMDAYPNPLKIVYQGYNAQLLFYVEAVNYARQKESLFLGDFSSLNPNDQALISQESVLDSIKKNFGYRILLASDPVKLISIGNRLPPFLILHSENNK